MQIYFVDVCPESSSTGVLSDSPSNRIIFIRFFFALWSIGDFRFFSRLSSKLESNDNPTYTNTFDFVLPINRGIHANPENNNQCTPRLGKRCCFTYDIIPHKPSCFGARKLGFGNEWGDILRLDLHTLFCASSPPDFRPQTSVSNLKKPTKTQKNHKMTQLFKGPP